MAKLLKLRRGSTTQHASFTGAEGEVTIDTTKDTAVVHDGAQAGGRPLLREDMSNLPAGTIDNADINASAAIDGTKISPIFGSQTITTTGQVAASDIAVSGTAPVISFTDTNANSDFKVEVDGGVFRVKDITNSNATRVKVHTSGDVEVVGNLDVGAGLDVTGTINATSNISTSGNITANNGTVTVSGTAPKIQFTETNDNPDYLIEANGGNIAIVDSTNSTTRFSVGSATTTVHNNLDVSNGVDVTGDITATGDATINGGDITISGTVPALYFNDTDHESDYQIRNNNGTFQILDVDQGGGTVFFQRETNADCTFTGNVNVTNGVDVVGNITATGTVDGRDVAADGSKLDGIESGATGDQTNAEIAAALSDQRPSMKGADFSDDGTGSPVVNIRCDDGSPWGFRVGNDGYSTGSNHGFMIYQANNGDCTMKHAGNSSWENIYIQQSDGSNNNTGILLDTGRAVNLMYQGNQRLGTTNAGVSVTGDMTASGNVTAYSDARLKNDVTTINDALGIVGKLRGVSYKWLETNTAGIGVIAQEIEEVLPEVVVTTRGTLPSTGETTEIKSVDYGKIVGVLINAINELKAEVDALKKPKKKGGK